MEQVKIGDTIKIIKMEGEPQYTNREGVVTHIDDAGQIHDKSESGISCKPPFSGTASIRFRVFFSYTKT